MCILSVLLKVVAYYDLSVLSMSMMVSKKKCGWVGWWIETSNFFGDFLNFFNFARPLSSETYLQGKALIKVFTG